MLIEFKVSNFLSFKEEVVLSLDSSSSKILSDNTFKEDDYSLLKSIVIYGANASGKSNLAKALLFFWQMIKDSTQFNVDTKIPRIPFMLDKNSKSKPSTFELTFIKNNTRYTYGFSCKEDGFVNEYLYYKPKNENKKLFFMRDETLKEKKEKFKFNVNKKDQEQWGLETINKKLYLPKAVNIHNYEALKEVYEFIINEIVIVLNNFNHAWGSEYTRNKLHSDKKFRKWVLNIMKKADFGGITDIRVKEEKRSGFEIKMEKGPIVHRPLQENEFYALDFIHKDEQGNEVVFKENLESTGTNKTLDILGPIYDILEKGKTLFIDEFEINLHPNITEFLVKLFHSKHNKKNGQLIVTTHDTTLLKNKDLFRRDQVYICSKDPNKSTKVNSLLDFDLRESLSFENAYLNGRVGGLPFIDETFFED